jgi:LAO/AO transport system kinase
VNRDSGRRDQLAAGVLAGDTRTIAQAISLLENDAPEARGLLAALHSTGGQAYTIGVTGPPGAGKSTLISALVREARAAGQSVGVVSIDPTSPFTDGALLGDRIRLAEHFLDPGVFIRSMGSRGQAGGLAASTLQTVLILGAAGKDVVFIETVGTGQGEIGVLGVADSVVLVLMPGSGDAIQALKSGIMEIPDLIALNKSDLPGAEQAAKELRQVLSLGTTPPALALTSARSGEGVAELWAVLERRRREGAGDGSLARRRGDNLVEGALAAATVQMRRYLDEAVRSDPELGAMLEQVRSGALDPFSAVDELVARMHPQ